MTGLRRLPAEHIEFVHGSQLRAADRMLSLCAALAAISVFIVDFRLANTMPNWILGLWTAFIIAVHFPISQMHRLNSASDYSTVTRSMLLKHGAWSFVQGLLWVVAMVLFTGRAHPSEIITLWTIACCLMAAVAIAYQSTPLSAASYILTIGGGAITMMLKHADPLLAAVVTTYAMLLLGASLRQAHSFGVQLTTNKLLAEKREVVSLLLKEHDLEAADSLWQTDIARRLTGVSPNFARMLGVTADGLEGRSGGCFTGRPALTSHPFRYPQASV